MAILSITEDVFLDAKKAARALGVRVKRRKPPAVQAILVDTADKVTTALLGSARSAQFCLAFLDKDCALVPSPFLSTYRQSALVREYERGLCAE